MFFPIVSMLTVPCEVDHTDPGPPDEYGNHPATVTTTTTEKCWVAQSTRGEADFVETEKWHIYLRPDVTLDASDAVRVAGEDFYVLGAPWPVIDPLTQRTSHIEATLVRRI